MLAGEEKKFVMKHVFSNVGTLQLGELDYGAVINNSGISWKIIGVWTNNPIVFNVKIECLKTGDTNDWSIETTVDSDKLGNLGKRTFSNEKTIQELLTFTYNDLLPQLDRNDFPVEFTIKIEKINGVEFDKPKREKLRNFDESTKKFSDVVLVIGDEKFYVCKMFLASQSSYFEALFMGNFDEAKQSEVKIKDIDASDFQNFLELINGESFVEDYTVDGLLHLSDFFDSKTVSRRCEQFLLEKSKKSSGEKLELALKYNMKKLAEKCVFEMKTTADIWNAVADVEKSVEDSIWKTLLLKALSLK